MSVATQFAKKGDITEGVVTDVDTSFANLDDKREVNLSQISISRALRESNRFQESAEKAFFLPT